MLNDYLSKHNLTRAAFARDLGVTGQCVSLWIHNQTIPRPDLLQKMSEITDGEIPVEYWTRKARDRAARK